MITKHYNLRRLLEVAVGRDTRNFRIDIEVHGRTVYLDRWNEPNAAETPIVGRGVGFTKAVRCAADGYQDVEEQKHVIAWALGGVRAVVQFPVDAFDCEKDGHEHLSQVRQTSVDPKTQIAASADVHEESVAESFPTLKVAHKGRLLPAKCLLQTRTIDSRNTHTDSSYIIADLWLTGVRKVYSGRYRKEPGDPRTRDPISGKIESKGIFDEESVVLEDYTKRVEEWVLQNSEGLRVFENVLMEVMSQVVNAMEKTGENSYALVYDVTKPAVLQLHPRAKGKSMVSKAAMKEIWGDV